MSSPNESPWENARRGRWVEGGGGDRGRGQRLLTSVKDEDRGVVPGPEAEWKTTLKILG